IMTTEFLSLSEDTTAQEAIRRLQRATDAEMVFYIYVTDKEDHLVGVLSLRQLLTVPPETPLKNIMTRDVMSVSVDMDQEEVARQVASYNLLAIPVVEKDNTLVGIITVDDVVDVIRAEATEDMLKMAGATEEDAQFKSSTVAAACSSRLPAGCGTDSGSWGWWSVCRSSSPSWCRPAWPRSCRFCSSGWTSTRRWRPGRSSPPPTILRASAFTWRWPRCCWSTSSDDCRSDRRWNPTISRGRASCLIL